MIITFYPSEKREAFNGPQPGNEGKNNLQMIY